MRTERIICKLKKELEIWEWHKHHCNCEHSRYMVKKYRRIMGLPIWIKEND